MTETRWQKHDTVATGRECGGINVACIAGITQLVCDTFPEPALSAMTAKPLGSAFIYDPALCLRTGQARLLQVFPGAIIDNRRPNGLVFKGGKFLQKQT